MKLALILGTLLLASCSDEHPPAPSAEEAEQLNEVEDLLNKEGDPSCR